MSNRIVLDDDLKREYTELFNGWGGVGHGRPGLRQHDGLEGLASAGIKPLTRQADFQ